MWNNCCHHFDYSPVDVDFLMREVTLPNGPYTHTKARAEKGVVYVTIEQRDPAHIGITNVDLTINCKSAVDAADILSYLARDLDFVVSLVLTEKG